MLEIQQRESIKTTTTSSTTLALLRGRLFANILREVVLEGMKNLYLGLTTSNKAINSSINYILLIPSIYMSYLIVEGKDSLIKIED